MKSVPNSDACKIVKNGKGSKLLGVLIQILKKSLKWRNGERSRNKYLYVPPLKIRELLNKVFIGARILRSKGVIDLIRRYKMWKMPVSTDADYWNEWD